MNSEKTELVLLRMSSAKNTLAEVELYHIPNQLWNTAVNRMYYACFYAIIGLLHYYNLDTKTHSGAKRMFELHFIKTQIINIELSEFYSNLFRMRQEADYEAEVNYEKEDVLPLVSLAKELINRIEFVLET